MLRVILLVCLLISPLAHAYDLAVDSSGVLIKKPECLVDGVKKVPYIASRELVWRNGSIIAIAGETTDGNPAVVYDPIALGDSPPEFQLWVLNHECHHHQGKHFGAGLSHPSYTQAVENSADKWATLRLFHQGLTPLQIKTVYDTIKDTEFHDKHTSRNGRLMRKFMGISIEKEYAERAERFKLYAKESLKLLRGG